ncbi:SSF1 protein, partial [Falcunculus frontatus]|nr:SSF1 protein [Falcunculus frontatus]
NPVGRLPEFPNSRFFAPLQSRWQRRERARARQRSELEFGSAPHSFVFPRGRVGSGVRSLGTDLRRVLEPFTARNLQV